MGNLVPASEEFDSELSRFYCITRLSALTIIINWLFKEFENRGTNIIEIGHDFYDIWWLLKEPF